MTLCRKLIIPCLALGMIVAMPFPGLCGNKNSSKSSFSTEKASSLSLEKALPLSVQPPFEDGSDISLESYEDGKLSERDLSSLFSGLFSSAMVGRYLDFEPAQRRAEEFRKQGLLAFALKKNFRENILLSNKEVGDFYVVMVGLFAEKKDADRLGQRLKAENRIRDYRILAVDDPGEISSTDTQNAALYASSGELSRQIQARVSTPLPPDSPVLTGEAFKKHMRGRYMGSYRDPLAARDEALRLSSGGWPASVEKEAGWYRVYLAETEDHRDFKADPRELKAAKSSASSQLGFFMVVDTSSLRGSFSALAPNAERSDASACAGYSEAGRLMSSLKRTIVYIPETTYLVSLTPIAPHDFKWGEIPGRVLAWWNDEQSRPVKKSIYGPAIYNRPELEKAMGGMKASPKEASLALGVTEAAIDFKTASGRKIVLIFSEFKTPKETKDIRDAMNRLKSFYGKDFHPLYIYGDTDGKGYELASQLAAAAGGQPWDGCRLLGDNVYFEKFIKSIFK